MNNSEHSCSPQAGACAKRFQNTNSLSPHNPVKQVAVKIPTFQRRKLRPREIRVCLGPRSWHGHLGFKTGASFSPLLSCFSRGLPSAENNPVCVAGMCELCTLRHSSLHPRSKDSHSATPSYRWGSEKGTTLRKRQVWLIPDPSSSPQPGGL